MKRNISILGICAILVVEGCDTIVQPGEMPYEKKLVISALLQAGKPVDQILIGKTMPPNQGYIPSQAAVTNANGSIVVDGNVHALIYSGYYQPSGTITGFGVYKTQSLVPEPGKTYSLTVEAEGLQATSSTLVPPIADIDTLIVVTVFKYGAAQYYLGVQLKQQSGATYAIGYSFSPSVTQAIDQLPGLLMKSTVGSLLREDMSVGGWRPDLPDSLTAVIFSYDEQYYDYYSAHQYGSGPGGIFGQPFGQENWNIHGGGIGLFIGATVTRQRVASQ